MKTATATITVSIGGVPMTFTAAGETDGDVCRLAGRLAYQVAGDAQDWATDVGTAEGRCASRADRADLTGAGDADYPSVQLAQIGDAR